MTLSKGNNRVAGFLIWIFETRNPEYFDCLITEESSHYPYYVHLHRDARFPVEFKFPPKPLKQETPEEQIYRAEYNAYAMCKDMTMPMWYLHATTLEKVMKAMTK